jgi:alkylation response protein AidB-like acyl-CoA dehydrogenase
MDFDLTDEQRLIEETAREFAESELAPVAAALDRDEDGREQFLGNLAKLAELGFMGLNIREEYGGTEAGVVAFSLAVTELARACSSTALTVDVTNMVAEVIQAVGNEQQKQLHLPKICSGEYPAGSFCLTEPGAGSDAAAIQTRAELQGDEWVLDGTKLWITSAPYAGVFVVWAVTDREAPRGKGISCFLVEAGTPGLQVGKEEPKMGQHAAASCEVVFDACRIPRENLLGPLNDGFRIALKELAGGRIGIGSLALGIGLSAMDYATRYALERVQFGRKIAEFQAIRWMIADHYTELEAARLLLLSAAFQKERGRKYAREASMAKLYSTEAANRACYSALQMLGGYGYSKEYPLERNTRDARVTTLYEGTSEIQRMIIARDILEALSQ